MQEIRFESSLLNTIDEDEDDEFKSEEIKIPSTQKFIK